VRILWRGGQVPGVVEHIRAGAVLDVLDVRADGTTEIQLVTWGKGSMTAPRQQPIEIDGSEPSRIVLAVTPNGSIIRVRDTNGNPTAIMRPSFGAFNAGDVTQAGIMATYTLFGLQLPSGLPAPGGKWTGDQKEEFSAAADLDLSQVQLREVRVTYAFAGARKYKGRDCLAISGSMPLAGVGGGIPTTFYFDSARGQLVGREAHVKRFGRQQADIDLTAVLTKVEQAGSEAQ
jgi:hypothetical protein